jgi:uncharacterized DUF497 family protein
VRFDWDKGNEAHIARHRVTVVEVEEAMLDPLAEIVELDVIGGEPRYSQIGSTSRGRLLVVAFTIRKAAIRPITAFDADSHTAAPIDRGIDHERKKSDREFCK